VAFQVNAALEELGKVHNFTVEQQTANGDADAFVNNLSTILLREPDGLIIDITSELAPRTADICDEYDIPVVCIYNKCVDADGVEIIPSVVTDQFYNGRTQMEYLNKVYKDYWGDIDRSKINLLIVDWSTNVDIYNRGVGALEKFNELFPGNTYYYGDTGAGDMTADSGFNVANGILSAHPEVEYWFIVGTVEDTTLGAGRAVEALGMDRSKVLMTASGAAILPGEWDAGYDGVWIANYSVPPYMYAGSALFGLFALMDGRATKSTLWQEHFLPGDLAARYSIGADMMTRADYKELLASVAAMFGVQ
jgi:ABC-type sugar transport system substrate-binding protein